MCTAYTYPFYRMCLRTSPVLLIFPESGSFLYVHHLEFYLRNFYSAVHPCHSRTFLQGSESRLRNPSIAVSLRLSRSKQNGVGRPAHRNSHLALESSTGATLDVVPGFIETFVPEVVPEPPQENGYRSLLPEDAIPNLQNILASCGQLMTSFR